MVKYLFFLVSVLFVINLNAQDGNDFYSITYVNGYKLFKNWSEPRKEYVRLIVNNGNSIHQTFNVMCMDSIKVKRKTTSSDRNKYFTFNDYTIKTKGDSIFYSEMLGGKQYEYSEMINLKWEISKDSTVQKSGYKCQFATTTYGGRSWEAWFTLDIPISLGPYKFHGLPGLIVEIQDRDREFYYELYGIIKTGEKKLEKLFEIEESKRLATSRNVFNKLKFKYNGLSISEKSKFRNQMTAINIKKYDQAGELSSFRDTSNADNVNLLEIPN